LLSNAWKASRCDLRDPKSYHRPCLVLQ